MYFNSLCLTTAVVASVLMLSACNRPGAAPATPAVNTAAAPGVAIAPVGPAPTAAAPAPATAEAAPEPVGKGLGKGMGGGKRGGKGGGKGGLRSACADDIKKFCTGGERVGRCLKSHASELSQACAQAREARKESRGGGR